MIGGGVVARVIGALSPRAATARAADAVRVEALSVRREALQGVRRVMMNYDAATGPRSTRWRAPSGSADEISRDHRGRLAMIGRDMIRNSPLAAAAVRVISGEVVGSGIPMTLGGLSPALEDVGRKLIARHMESAAIDADGRLALYGIQRLVVRSVVGDGEVFVRRIRRRVAAGRDLPLPFQVQVIEGDHLDTMKSGRADGGAVIRDGIEYGPDADVIAYHLFAEAPSSGWLRLSRAKSERVPARDICHIFRSDRPGQGRGVSWFAPVMLSLQNLDDAVGAQVTRQKIAACFAAFVLSPEEGDARPMRSDADDLGGEVTIEPGTVQDLRPGEKIEFATPPGVDGFDGFARLVHRLVAAGLGITYEALTGDLGEVNFSSGKMGRMAMWRNVDDWRADMLVPSLGDTLARWFLEAWAVTDAANRAAIMAATVSHTAPARLPIEPLKEANAAVVEVQAGFRSRSDVIRSQGRDPKRVAEEIDADNAADKLAGRTLKTTTTTTPERVAAAA
jgi:lambda family phage portal protein